MSRVGGSGLSGDESQESESTASLRPCSCGRIKIGFEVTEHRNWNPDCLEHGIGSAWYMSPEQIRKRAEQNERIRDLHRQVKEARKRMQ